MPRLPSPEDLGLVAPRPSRGITEVSPVLGRPDLLTGKVMQDIGAAMEAEAAKFEDLVAEDALNKLREKRVEMTYGKTGFGNVRGSQIVERPVMQEFPDALNREIEGIAGGLNSSRAKLKFQQAASRELTGYKTDLVRHVANETNTYAGQVFTSKIGTLGGIAALGVDDPVKLQGALAETGKAITDEAARLGYTGPVLELFKQTKFGEVHDGVIKSLLTNGRAKDAAEYVTGARDRGELAQNQFEQYSATIKGKRDWEIGNTLAAEAVSMQKQGKSATEIEDYLAAQTKDNKDAYAAAQSVWTQRQAADKMVAQEQKGGFAAQFWSKPSSATVSQIRSSTEFLSLPKSVQGSLIEEMHKGLQHEDAVARARRSEAYSTPQAFSTFLETLSSPALATMSKEAIYGLSGTIGPQNTQRLLAEQKSQQQGAERFRIDPKIVDQYLPDELKGKGAQNKAMQSAYNGIVAVELHDWKERNKGKQPNDQEQLAIISSALKEYKINRPYWFDTTVKAYELKDMPADFDAKARTELTKQGLPATPANIRRLWAQQPAARR